MSYFTRQNEIVKIQELCREQVHHIHIYGEAGIGKTSLLNELIYQSKHIYYVTLKFFDGAGRNDQTFLSLCSQIYNLIQQTNYQVSLTSTIWTQTDLDRLIYEDHLHILCTEPENLDNLLPYKKLLINLISEILIIIAKNESIVLAMDDVHWINDFGEEFEEIFATKILRNESSCIIISLSRDKNITPLPLETKTIEIPALNSNESLNLLKSIILDPVVNISDFEEEINQATNGNPYFVTTLGQYLISDSQPDNLRKLPNSKAEILELASQTLNSSQLRVLSASSVIGNEFLYGELACLLPELDGYLLDIVYSLIELKLLIVKNQTYYFNHPLLKDFHYNQINAQDKTAWHYALFLLYRSQSIHHQKNKTELCAYHAYHSNAYFESIPFLRYVAKNYQRKGESKAAEKFWTLVQEAYSKIDYIDENKKFVVSVKIMQTCLAQGKIIQARNLFDQIKTKYKKNLSHFKNLEIFMEVQILLEWAEGKFTQKTLDSLAPSTNHKTELSMANILRLTTMSVDIGRYEHAIKNYKIILKIPNIEKLDNKYVFPPVVSICYAQLAICYAGLNDREKCYFYALKSKEFIDKIVDGPKKIYGLTFTAKALNIIDEKNMAKSLINQAYKLSENYPIGVMYPHVLTEYATSLKNEHNYIEALKIIHQCKYFVEANHFTVAQFPVHLLEAEIYMDLGMYNLAYELLLRCEDQAKESLNPVYNSKIYLAYLKYFLNLEQSHSEIMYYKNKLDNLFVSYNLKHLKNQYISCMQQYEFGKPKKQSSN